MVGMPRAFLSALGADTGAGLKQSVNDQTVVVGRSRKKSRCDCAHVRAVVVQSDARAHFIDIALSEVRVGA
jgi:antitoxin component of MazEF toxin-antitoxin module